MSSHDHKIHADHPHQHGPACGHTAIKHGDHLDYLHDGHLHHPHGDHVDEHTIEVSVRHPRPRRGLRPRRSAPRRPRGLPGRRSPAPPPRGPLRRPRPAPDRL